MRILMISPHPTYSPRGTPISVLNRCRALCALGHEVDLVTYGIGTDVDIAGLRWIRAPVAGIRTVGVGPSLRKIPLDLAVFARAVRQAARGRGRYDVVHSHEEAGPVGALVAAALRVPHVYDMGNDLSVVLRNYGFSARHPLTRSAELVERFTVRRSQVVIAHFDSLAQRVDELTGGAVPVGVVENVPIEAPPRPAMSRRIRARWSPDGWPVALYTGTLEDYQGIPLLIEALATVARAGTAVRLVVVGGSARQQDALRADVAGQRLDDRVRVAGTVDQALIRSCLDAADILVSPRASGSNTPLKIFSYLHAGKPVLATRTAAHLQVLDDRTALLVEPTAVGLADGLTTLLTDPHGSRRRAEAARAVAVQRYGLRAYLAGISRAYEFVGGGSTDTERTAQACTTVENDLAAVAP